MRVFVFLRLLSICIAFFLALQPPAIAASIPLDSCDNLLGGWQGHGIARLGTIVKCFYSGTGYIIPGNTPDHYLFAADLSVTDGMCPDNLAVRLKVSCKNNTVAFENDDAYAHGKMTPDGGAVSLTGWFYFDLFGDKQKATIDSIEMQKQSTSS